MPADTPFRGGSPPRPPDRSDPGTFSVALHALRRWAGLTLTALEYREPTLKKSTTGDYLSGARLPDDWEWVHTFATACLSNRGLPSSDIAGELSYWRAAWAHMRGHRKRPPISEPPVIQLPAPPNNANRIPAQLPKDVGHFTGRDNELVLLGKLTATGKPGPVIVAVTGPASSGKTGFVVHWSHQHQHEYPDGILYADLNGSGAESPDSRAVLGDFLHALDKPSTRIPESLQGRAAVFRSLTHGLRMLIVLDDAASYEQIRHFIPSGPECRVLITGRGNIPELFYIDDARPIVLPPLGTRESMELLASMINDRRTADTKSLRALAAKADGNLHALRAIATIAVYHPEVPLFHVVSYVNVERSHLPHPQIPAPIITKTITPGPGSRVTDDNTVEDREHYHKLGTLNAEDLQKLADSDHSFDRIHAAIWITNLQESHPKIFFTLLAKLMQDSDKDVRNVAASENYELLPDGYIETMTAESQISRRDAARLAELYDKLFEDN